MTVTMRIVNGSANAAFTLSFEYAHLYQNSIRRDANLGMRQVITGVPITTGRTRRKHIK